METSHVVHFLYDYKYYIRGPKGEIMEMEDGGLVMEIIIWQYIIQVSRNEMKAWMRVEKT